MNPNASRTIQTELVVLSSFQHSRLARLMGVCNDLQQNEGTFGLVMEYMSRGSLYDLITRGDIYRDINGTKISVTKLRIAKDVCEGMRFLHSCQVMHNDLKSTNVLIDQDGRAKITDFGISRYRYTYLISSLTHSLTHFLIHSLTH